MSRIVLCPVAALLCVGLAACETNGDRQIRGKLLEGPSGPCCWADKASDPVQLYIGPRSDDCTQILDDEEEVFEASLQFGEEYGVSIGAGQCFVLSAQDRSGVFCRSQELVVPKNESEVYDIQLQCCCD